MPESTPRRWPAWIGALALLLALATPPCFAELGAGRPANRAPTVRVLAPSAEDSRIPLVEEAIAFWNLTFEDLGLAPRLVKVEVVVDSPVARTVENYAHQIATLAGRMTPGSREPRPPREITALDGDVVLLLSTQRVMPFAWPFDARPADSADSETALPESPQLASETLAQARDRYLIAIPVLDSTAPPFSRVISHELGHALGLEHGSDPGALMCQPCERRKYNADSDARRLSEADRERLLALYGQEVPF